jgi:hypothetical protein
MFSAIMDPYARGQAFKARASLMGPFPREDYRYEPLLAGHGDNRVVAVGPPCGWVNENMDVLVEDRRRTWLPEHGVDVLSLKGLLQGVKCQPGKLRLDEVGPVLHDGLELHMAVRALPPVPSPASLDAAGAARRKGKTMGSPGDQVKHMDALGGPALGLARCAGELDAEKREDGLASDPIPHLHQARVKVDLARKRADGKEGRGAHDHQRGDGFLQRAYPSASSSSDEDLIELPGWASAYVKESWVDVSGLLEDNDVSSGALGRRNLPERGAENSIREADKMRADRFWDTVQIV